jgi:hypothetical protein
MPYSHLPSRKGDGVAMKTAGYYTFRKWFRRVFWTIAIIGGLVLATMGIDHINWVGDHYCFKSSIECFFPEGGNK